MTPRLRTFTLPALAPRAVAALALTALALTAGCSKPAAPADGGEEPEAAVGREAAGAEAAAPEAAADATATPAGGADQTLVVYSGRGAVLVEPLFEMFTGKTGIKVDVRYGKSTGELANRLASEGAQTPADVFFAQDSGYLGALAKADHLAELPKDILDLVLPQDRHTEGRWVGVSGRARVLVYNPDKTRPEELPQKLMDLADPKWQGRMGWAPTNASLHAHVSALRHLWGETRTEEWLTAVSKLEPKRFPKNSPQVKAVSAGEIMFGWVNHYYLHKLKASDPSLQAANFTFPDSQDPGNLMMLSGVAVVGHSTKEKLARQLVRFLLGDEAQRYLTEKVYEYPVRREIDPSEGLPEVRQRMVRVDQSHLADVPRTLELMRKLNLN